MQYRILQDWEIEDEATGETILLLKDTVQFLDFYQCEALLRQGVLKPVKKAA
jgi:hypothetical protein